MKAIRRKDFISVFVIAQGAPGISRHSWDQVDLAETTLKRWSNWRQPGGSVEIIRDTRWHGNGPSPQWRYEVVWYDRDRANALLFKLTYAGRNPLVD